jgi:nitroimidazol reductase NimA-like FMN-containing flavoprotein (pyridoxamine 5'-phosphate oxidase superfamily)
MTPEEVDAFLHATRTLNVATIGPTGHPHLVAMWYGFLDGQIAFWTFGRSQKIQNLRRNPKITALAEEGKAYAELKGVELIGTGRIVDDYDTILRIALSTAERHVGPAGAGAEARPFLEAQARKRLGVIIDVERVVSWDHTKLAGAY